MIVIKSVNVKIAELCCAAATPYHTETFINSGKGLTTQFLYVLKGSGNLVMTDPNVFMAEGSIVDLTPYANQPLIGSTLDNGMFWIGVNPKTNTWLQYKAFSPGSYTANPLDKEQYLVSLKGSITVGTKSIQELNFAMLPANVDTSFIVESNGFAIIISNDIIL